MKINEIMDLAESIANKSECKVKVSCILIDNNNKVVATGYNHHALNGRKMGKYTIHAEMDALSKVRKPSNNLTAFIFRDKGKIITPCRACQKLLDTYGITKIWHTAGRTSNSIKIERKCVNG